MGNKGRPSPVARYRVTLSPNHPHGGWNPLLISCRGGQCKFSWRSDVAVGATWGYVQRRRGGAGASDAPESGCDDGGGLAVAVSAGQRKGATKRKLPPGQFGSEIIGPLEVAKKRLFLVGHDACGGCACGFGASRKSKPQGRLLAWASAQVVGRRADIGPDRGWWPSHDACQASLSQPVTDATAGAWRWRGASTPRGRRRSLAWPRPISACGRRPRRCSPGGRESASGGRPRRA